MVILKYQAEKFKCMCIHFPLPYILIHTISGESSPETIAPVDFALPASERKYKDYILAVTRMGSFLIILKVFLKILPVVWFAHFWQINFLLYTRIYKKWRAARIV